MTGGPYRYAVRATTAFRKAAKRAAKRGKDMSKLKKAVDLLARGAPLPAVLRKWFTADTDVPFERDKR